MATKFIVYAGMCDSVMLLMLENKRWKKLNVATPKYLSPSLTYTWVSFENSCAFLRNLLSQAVYPVYF